MAPFVCSFFHAKWACSLPEDDGLAGAAQPLRELVGEGGQHALDDGELRSEAERRHHDEEEDGPQLPRGRGEDSVTVHRERVSGRTVQHTHRRFMAHIQAPRPCVQGQNHSVLHELPAAR